MEALNDRGKTLKGTRCLVLGVAYKPNIDDLRESPALDVIGLLQEKGALVSYHDPYIPSMITLDGSTMTSQANLLKAVKQSDCVLIITDHSDYDYSQILDSAEFIFDARNALGKQGVNSQKVVRL